MEKASTMDYINKMFPTEASLSGVEPLMKKIHSEIRVVFSDFSSEGRVGEELLQPVMVKEKERLKSYLEKESQ
ncbi:hypothetical protein L1887_02806 [Cichorium endivia]|nr:hypothetical protein L1887_02806 [Cichorium endivia]